MNLIPIKLERQGESLIIHSETLKHLLQSLSAHTLAFPITFLFPEFIYILIILFIISVVVILNYRFKLKIYPDEGRFELSKGFLRRNNKIGNLSEIRVELSKRYIGDAEEVWNVILRVANLGSFTLFKSIHKQEAQKFVDELSSIGIMSVKDNPRG